MGVVKLVVELKPHHPVYVPGQVLKGEVSMVVMNSVTCREIRVNVFGGGYVMWKRGSGKRTITYISREYFMNLGVKVWQSSGIYTYPFTFRFANPLPSSVEGMHGYVRYEVKAVVDRVRAFNTTTSLPFTVNSIVDLNSLISVSRKPIRKEADQTTCCLFCTSGPIHLTLEAARTGYVPGEEIVVYGQVANHSNSVIKYSELSLVQQLTYHCKKRSKVELQTLHREYRPEVRPGGRQDWSGVKILVPPVPPSYLPWCQIIDIKHYLVLSAKLGLCRNVMLSAEVLIGNVPLPNTLEEEGVVGGGGGGRQVGSVIIPRPDLCPAPLTWQVVMGVGGDEEIDPHRLQEPARVMPRYTYGCYSTYKSSSKSSSQAAPVRMMLKRNSGNKSYSPRYITYNTSNYSHGDVTFA
ncbi:hypothetical protein Pmani_026836 [Petrolisthes manimaculis]|uniref:Arrestin C-terminal-like domain-containing protein n=1 Tax=Petrolisthes manimaculis TaxID=1843537 RepID=A0AAE1TX19_9EUCA|nr:hypothetical protein Pmani_026836 [Petrolisthes manimaculis]